jgi:hypothetical protein
MQEIKLGGSPQETKKDNDMDAEKLRGRAHPIHPLDFGLLLFCDPDVGDVVLRGGKKYPTELIEYKGSLYRQTVKEAKYKTEQRIKMLEQTLETAKLQLK